MKILILGAGGMLGHELLASLESRHDVAGTLHGEASDDGRCPDNKNAKLHFTVDVRQFSTVQNVVEQARPDAVVNAVGVIKQRINPDCQQDVREINSIFPHRLADYCRNSGIRVLHLSTDCVFSGNMGMYCESDIPDSTDLYGLSKMDGELDSDGCITLRTSMIGLETAQRKSLVEWFLAQRGSIKGYRRTVFSGFTTRELARIIEHILVSYPNKSGLYHVSSEPIDKFTLLSGLRDRLNLNLDIIPDDELACNRSLDSTRFRTEFAYDPPTWDEMLDELSDQIKARTQ